MSWESQLIAFLSASLVRPLFLAMAAVLILWTFRVRHPASLYGVWTVVLTGMLLLPLISLMAPRVNLPLLPPTTATPHDVRPLPSLETVEPSRTPEPGTITAPRLPASKASSAPPVKVQWTVLSLIPWVYLAGFLAMVVRSAVGWALLRRVVSMSMPLRRRLRESSDLVVPVAVGLLHPVVILPSGWRGWSKQTRRAVLAHEFAHIRRHDAIGAALGRIAKCVFWFHPLAWWISRKVAELAELACDAAALQRVRDPSAYSRVLLQFAGDVTAAGHRMILPGLAMSSSSGLGGRIDRVFELSDRNLRRLVCPGLILALMGLPIMCLAATVGLSERARVSRAESQIAQAVPAAPAALPPVMVAQATPAPAAAKLARPLTPAFDKATIEIAGSPVSGELCWGGCGGPGTPYPESPNEITYRHFTLKKILLRAYDIKDFQIDIRDELDASAYTIQATAPVGTSKEQFQLMLRNLLAEKLHLTMHHEARDFVSSYDLVVASGGPKLREQLTVDSPVNVPIPGVVIPNGNGWTLLNIRLRGKLDSVSVLGKVLASSSHIPVENKTGLTGDYDINYSEFLSPMPPRISGGIPVPDTPSLANLNARLEPLGLVLEEKHALLDVLVVDHLDPLPAN